LPEDFWLGNEPRENAPRGPYRRLGDVSFVVTNTSSFSAGCFGSKPTSDLSFRLGCTKPNLPLQSSSVPFFEGTYAGALSRVYDLLLFVCRVYTGVTWLVSSTGALYALPW
jgi:hypothetical protein